jgi:alkylation response protein AidB-like acyl-CoA dehydrogenase
MSRTSVRCGEADEPAGHDGHTIPEADGGQGGSLMDAVIAIEQTAAVCPRSADVVQFGNFGPIRTFAEYGTDYQKKKWLSECLAGNAGHQSRHERARRRLAATDLKTSAKAGRQELHRQRHQGVLDLQP